MMMMCIGFPTFFANFSCFHPKTINNKMFSKIAIWYKQVLHHLQPRRRIPKHISLVRICLLSNNANFFYDVRHKRKFATVRRQIRTRNDNFRDTRIDPQKEYTKGDENVELAKSRHIFLVRICLLSIIVNFLFVMSDMNQVSIEILLF